MRDKGDEDLGRDLKIGSIVNLDGYRARIEAVGVAVPRTVSVTLVPEPQVWVVTKCLANAQAKHVLEVTTLPKGPGKVGVGIARFIYRPEELEAAEMYLYGNVSVEAVTKLIEGFPHAVERLQADGDALEYVPNLNHE